MALPILLQYFFAGSDDVSVEQTAQFDWRLRFSKLKFRGFETTSLQLVYLPETNRYSLLLFNRSDKLCFQEVRTPLFVNWLLEELTGKANPHYVRMCCADSVALLVMDEAGEETTDEEWMELRSRISGDLEYLLQRGAKQILLPLAGEVTLWTAEELARLHERHPHFQLTVLVDEDKGILCRHYFRLHELPPRFMFPESLKEIKLPKENPADLPKLFRRAVEAAGTVLAVTSAPGGNLCRYVKARRRGYEEILLVQAGAKRAPVPHNAERAPKRP